VSNPIVLIDVDGVLAQFNERFLALLNTCNGGTALGFPQGLAEPNQWKWFEAAGFPKKVVNEAWDFAQRTPGFWGSLEAYPGVVPFLRDLSQLRDDGRITPYFCTSRTCPGVAYATQWWLESHGFSRPNVIVVKTGMKDKIVAAVGATAMLDDYDENFDGVPSEVTCYLYNRGWNQEAEGYDKRVYTLDEFLCDVIKPAVITDLRPEAA
jgi:hypothetical protein